MEERRRQRGPGPELMAGGGGTEVSGAAYHPLPLRHAGEAEANLSPPHAFGHLISQPEQGLLRPQGSQTLSPMAHPPALRGEQTAR